MRFLPCEKTFHLQDQLIHIAWLKKKIIGTRTERINGFRHITLPGEDEHAGVMIDLFYLAQNIYPPHPFHDQIGYHHVERSSAEFSQSCFAACCCFYIIIASLQVVAK